MIPLLDIELDRFRNYFRKRFDFSSETVLLFGENGTGKTNLLEAVSYLSLLRSFRGHVQSRELCAFNESIFNISATLDKGSYKERLSVSETRSGKRELKIGGSKISRSSEFIMEFRTVAFVPEDKFIISGSSGYRRRFFDIMISMLDPEYLTALMCYNRALAQRNKALKSNAAMAKLFEPELAAQVEKICSKRKLFAAKTAEVFNRISDSRYNFEISYEPDYPLESDGFLEHLSRIRKREEERFCTLTGPQRDEFDFYFLGKPLRIFGSTGQTGISALLLKMSEFELVKTLARLPVIALIDDVTGELDGENCQIFLDIVKSADQSFFTFSREKAIPDLGDHQRIDLS